jgi:deoxyribodipyrimidine photo-lyase
MKNLIYFWFRRDLRLQDNHGLYRALQLAKAQHKQVQCVFIFDTNILDRLSNKSDARVQFLHQEISLLKRELQKVNSDLEVWHGNPINIWQDEIQKTSPFAIFCNTDYEPSAIIRDRSVGELCDASDVEFHSFKDICIFERSEVVKDDSKPYTVFTPYSKKWKIKLAEHPILHYPSESYLAFLSPRNDARAFHLPTLNDLGFEHTNIAFPEKSVSKNLIKEYTHQRNFPAIQGTSRLGIHFRFGTISIREKLKKALLLNETFVNELIWRDFYMQILWHFPQVVGQAFKPAYDKIEWRNNDQEFEQWKSGQTGFPIVDAGMRELNTTGFMHNRVRMIVASFLTKHLLIDWRWGEAYFAEKLLDFELASNNGGWQWAAGCGVDAAPYFRVFNPTLQTEKFDKNYEYIKKWVPEFGTQQYAKPMVDHALARKRCLETYDAALKNL